MLFAAPLSALPLCLSPRLALAQSGGNNISGTITLDGCIASAVSAQPITFYFASTDNPYAFTRTTTLNPNGSFTLANIPADTYQLHIKGAKWLASVQPINTTAGNVTGLTATLEPGDSDNNNTVDVLDFGNLVNAYGSTASDPNSGYDPNVDFNCDGSVDVLDFGLLVNTYGSNGDIKPNPATVVTDLTLSVTGVMAGGGLTGTVTISAPAPTGGATLLLASSDGSAMLLPSVTVPAGQTTATFPIGTNAVGDPLTATISASSGHWMQSAPLSIVPAGYNLSIQNLSVDPAKGAVLLNWKDLPEGSVKGYNVYRISNNVPVKLNAAPLTDAVYADNNVMNGTAYSYQVTVVDVNGAQGAKTAMMSATPITTNPSISWLSAPTVPASASGTVSLYSSQPSGDFVSAFLLVDGKIVSSMDRPNTDENPYPGGMQVNLDTTTLTNGVHTVQIVGYINSTQAVVSPAIAVQTSNGLGGITTTGVVETDSSDFAFVNVPAPAGTQAWRIELRDSNNVLVTDWQSTSPLVKLTWPGTDASNIPVLDGNYTLNIFAFQSSGLNQLIKNLIKISLPPTALSLTKYPYPQSAFAVQNDENIVSHIQSAFDKLKVNTAGFRGLAISSKDHIPDALLRRWMSSSMTVFHLHTHGYILDAGGAAFAATWDDFAFKPRNSVPTDKPIEDNRHVIYIPDVVTNPYQYSFVFMDFCHSGGGGPVIRDSNGSVTNPGLSISDPKYNWAHAFGIYTDGIEYTDPGGLFLGWDGDSVSNFIGTPPNYLDAKNNNWYYWRMSFWDYVADYGIIAAGSKATTAAQIHHLVFESIPPWEVDGQGRPRMLYSGDGFAALYQ